MSFLLNSSPSPSPTSPSSPSPTSGNNNGSSSNSSPTSSVPDSLNSFFPGIAETNATTVLDEGSKSAGQIILPTPPPRFGVRSRSQAVAGVREDEIGVDEDEDEDGGTPLPKAPLIRRMGGGTAGAVASTSTSAQARTWPAESSRMQNSELSPHGRSAAPMFSPTTPGGATPEAIIDSGLGLGLFGQEVQAEVSEESLQQRKERRQSQQRTRFYASSSSESASSQESDDITSTSSESESESESSSLFSDRRRRTTLDAESAGSSIPRIRVEAESLLFSHSLPPSASRAQDKGKGKERERERDRESERKKDARRVREDVDREKVRQVRDADRLAREMKRKGKMREMDVEDAADMDRPIGVGRDMREEERERERGPQYREHHRRRSSSGTVKIRTTSGQKVYKYEEPEFSRDFLLIVAMCFGLACAFVLLARPAMMSLLGRPGSVGYLD
ncbi:hypothetical protein BDN70DRAFT_251366 [Pholiota conissans]|uniref:Transmembrane protein n=1 Tax=Pholiota conissans TaxID=109636 RepID=A0A9P5YTA2_9AGAR|nr:hypothetical protein BDN70DRAFT_251366 [Pholiota conissans]